MAPRYIEIPQLAITYYNYNNGTIPRPSSTLERCKDPKACPTMNKDFRIALTQAIDKQAFIDATFAGVGELANSFVMPGIPGYDKPTRPVSVRPRPPPRTHMDHGARGARLASAADSRR